MIKKTITYTDFNGVERTEDFFFNFNKMELTKLELRLGADVQTYINGLIKDGDADKMINLLDIMILDAYGVKSNDGRSFRKSPEIRETFEYSNAYAELFEELLTVPGAAKEFGEGLASTVSGGEQKEGLKIVDNKPASIHDQLSALSEED